MIEFIDEEAKARIERRGITNTDILCCLGNPTDKYIHQTNQVLRAQLPDGRNIKVTIQSGTISVVVNAFIHQ